MGTFCEGLLNCVDLIKAFDDVRIQFFVSVGFLIIMAVSGFLIGRYSFRKAHEQSLKKSDATASGNRKGLRLRLRHPVVSPPRLQPNNWWSEFWQGISTELFGAIFTTLLLGLGVLVFEQYADIQNRKEALILQLGSPDNAFALEAVRLLRNAEWVTDGTLADETFSGADLSHAGLEDADLSDADLMNAILDNADLRNADLSGADLQGASLIDTDFDGAKLIGADLQGSIFSAGTFVGADLSYAKLNELNLFNVLLTDTVLCGTDLRGTNLQETGLENSDLERSILGIVTENGETEVAILPNGDPWSEDIFPLVPCER